MIPSNFQNNFFIYDPDHSSQQNKFPFYSSHSQNISKFPYYPHLECQSTIPGPSNYPSSFYPPISSLVSNPFSDSQHFQQDGHDAKKEEISGGISVPQTEEAQLIKRLGKFDHDLNENEVNQFKELVTLSDKTFRVSKKILTYKEISYIRNFCRLNAYPLKTSQSNKSLGYFKSSCTHDGCKAEFIVKKFILTSKNSIEHNH